MSRKFSQQKAALTRALRSGDVAKVVGECRRVKREWGDAWPDDWSRWERALYDVDAPVKNMDDL